MTARERDLATRRGRLACLHWAQPGAPRALALHGWLDNAASFTPLAPCLEGIDLVALDLPGHGQSEHRPPGAHYYFMDYLWDIEAALDALGWDSAALLGHSLGGAVSCSFAAAAPDRVTRLATLDALGALSGDPADAGKRLRRALAHGRRDRSELRTYPDLEAAVAARLEATPMDPGACRILCERALRPVDGGFQWRTDRRLRWISPSVLTEQQILAILAAIEAPVLSIGALPLAPFIDPATVEPRMAAVRDLRHHSIQGHHHFHMEQPDEIAGWINDFLTTEDGDDA